MSARTLEYQYAMLRLVPRVERGEGFNVAVVLLCRQAEFVGMRTRLDAELLARFAPGCDAGLVRDRLAHYERIVAGEAGAGPIAQLTASERYHWIVAPSSTILQPSPAHTGVTDDPAALLDRLFQTLVLR